MVKDGHLIFARGYGLADAEAQEPVQPDSLFRWESMSKTVTAVAIMRLVEDGKLNLDDPVFTILNQYSPYNGRWGDSRLTGITVRQLLQHTGGWDRLTSLQADPVDGEGVVKATSATHSSFPPSIDTVIRYMLAQRLDFAPGARFAYSPFGYELLGRVIEKISGQPYATFVRQRVLDPLGLDRVQQGSAHLEGRLPGEVKYYDYPGAPRIHSYVSSAREMQPRPYGFQDFDLTDSAGAWVGSAIDAAKLVAMLDGSRPRAPIGPDSFQAMLKQSQPQTWIDANSWYGFGLFVWPLGDGLLWGHGGYNPGAQTYFYHWPNGAVCAFLFNTTGTDSSPTGATAYVSPAIRDVLSAITNWPDHDQFPRYYRPRIAPSGVINSASSQAGPLSPGSVITVSGVDLGGKDAAMEVSLRDAGGAQRQLNLLYGGPDQLISVLPGEAAAGDATLLVHREGWPDAEAALHLAMVAPGLFTTNQSGLAAASLVRSRPGQQPSWEQVFPWDEAGHIVAKPIAFVGDDEELVLILYCTGVRGRRAEQGVAVEIGGLTVGATSAAPQGQYPGLDQVTVRLPRGLAGAGEVSVSVEIEGAMSNTVSLTFQ